MRAARYSPRRFAARVVLALLVLLSPLAGAEAQQPGPAVDPAREVSSTQVVIPGKGYDASPLREFIMGSNYRTLWTTPIEAPVLDIGGFAGGLKPRKKVGGGQTVGLRFQAADGTEYNFRSVNKTGRGALSEEVQGSIFEQILQDRRSRGYPAASLIASALLDAAGVPHARPTLYVMPDDPALGEFQQEFAGLLGTLEEETPRIEGASGLLTSYPLFDTLLANPSHQLDARHYLRARLMDILLGDWDRHAEQWQWAAFPGPAGTTSWRAVPEDFDWAFSLAGTPFVPLVRQIRPGIVGFGDEYPPILNLTWSAKDLDRRILSRLERAAWDSVTIDVTSRLTDSVIMDAVRRQPAAFLEVDGGEELRRNLRERRDKLGAAAAQFYTLLAGEVDLHGTNAPDFARIEHDRQGVTITIRSGTSETVRRRFDRTETSEVRVFLHGGADSAVAVGKSSGTKVRVVGEKTDWMKDSSGADNRFYRERLVERRDENFAPPNRETDKIQASQAVNWGKQWQYWPWLAYKSSSGMLVGVQVDRYRYSFRSSPFRTHFMARAGYALGERGGRGELLAERTNLIGPFRGRFGVEGSQIESNRFFGFGNETPLVTRAVALVRQDMVMVHPELTIGNRFNLAFGPFLKVTWTDRDPGTVATRLAPPGLGRQVLGGAQGSITWALGKGLPADGSSLRFRLEGVAAQTLEEETERFARGTATGGFSVTAPVPLSPTLMLRGGGSYVWGDYLFQEAAYIGGLRSLRGFDRQRFAGDAAVFAGTGLWLKFGHWRAFAADFGVTGVADAGRVYMANRPASERWYRDWHYGAGGGIWFGIPNFTAINIIAVQSEEGRSYYIYTGLGL